MRLVMTAILLLAISAVATAQVPLTSTPTWTTSTLNVYSTGMVWRDVDNDGYIDVFYSRGNDIVRATNAMYRSKYGSLPSAASWVSSNAEYSGHATGGDINDDGFVDFFASNFLGPNGFGDPNRSDLYINTGGWLPGAPSWYTGDYMYSFSCAFGDVDNDGDLDLALATGEAYNSVFQTDRLYFNVNGTFQSLPGWQSSWTSAAFDVTWGDVDKDGDLDLAFCYDDKPTSVFFNSSGSLETTPSWQAAITEPANTLCFGDVNGDDWLDLVVAHNFQLGGSGYFRVYYNNGAGALNTTSGWNSLSGGYGSGLALYDYDNDGDQDLAGGRWFEQPQIFENTDNELATIPLWLADIASVTEDMAWVDINGSGVEIRADTITTGLNKKLFYTRYSPLYSLDSVVADGTPLGHSDYCYDLITGWVSLKNAASSELQIHYRYSFTNDLAIANWDTVNMVYGNTRAEYVDFAPSATVGWAPLTVNFTGLTSGASNWLYKFGDGGSSTSASPQHLYAEGGAFDLYVENVSPAGWHNRTARKMIRVLADTLHIPDLVGSPGEVINMPIRLRNAHPMETFVLPLVVSGDFGLNYSGFSVAGCRTEDFHQVKLTKFAFNKLVFLFQAGQYPLFLPLEPGDGPIINLQFTVPSPASGAATIDTTTFTADSLYLNSGYMAYQPRVIAGSVSIGICGDMNGSGIIDITDLTYLVAFMFKGGPPPVSLELANLNGVGPIDISDLTYLVSYMFRNGPAPNCN